MNARRRRPLIAVAAVATVVLALVLAAHTRWSLAAYLGTQAVTTLADADEVPRPTSLCTAISGAPNELTLDHADDGLDVLEYRVEISVDVVPSGSFSWQTADAADGTPMLPIGESYWPADTAQVGWGIEGWSLFESPSWSGAVAVQAIGPGGWTSDQLMFDWTIQVPALGSAVVSCTPH